MRSIKAPAEGLTNAPSHARGSASAYSTRQAASTQQESTNLSPAKKPPSVVCGLDREESRMIANSPKVFNNVIKNDYINIRNKLK